VCSSDLIGFKQMPETSRVFVRLSDAPLFQITEVGNDVIRVELENTRVKRRNDARFLDTSFFASAVAMVSPRKQGTSTMVEIRLKQKVPWQQKVEGDMLAIDFERPAAMRAHPAAAAPAEAAPAAPEPQTPEAQPAEPEIKGN
jgi:colicin import membrane protein